MKSILLKLHVVAVASNQIVEIGVKVNFPVFLNGSQRVVLGANGRLNLFLKLQNYLSQRNILGMFFGRRRLKTGVKITGRLQFRAFGLRHLMLTRLFSLQIHQ